MECIFLNAAGTTLFVRDDMESGHWVQEQMNVTAEFPFDAGKVIQIGQRIALRDPATDTLEVFEIVNVVNQEPEHFQQITAEHICIAELSDEHINKTEITDKTAAQALTTALTGTLWSVGNNSASGTQSADLSRGSVWDAVNTIQQNWNVYITPRVTISSAGAITGRYLDITPAQGTWRGLRLSVRKNLIDPAVTYDDSEVYTALYGYGGNIDVPQQSGDDVTQELTFADQIWTATSSHPAKPSGQTYLEWPEKTAIYGRNGRPRYGYYQNASIKDAAVLLEKTWESLQKSCEPSITIAGTCVDLYRLGYKDQPIRLHDMAIVEIEETGEQFYRQVICNDVDLVDPTGSRPEIGDYIPNIVYINRDTNEKATNGRVGGGGGGGGRGSMTNLEDEDLDWYTEFIKTKNQIGMVIRKKNGINSIDALAIVGSINDSTGETTALVKADHVNISATNTAHLLAGSIFYDADGNLVFKESSGGGIVIQRTESGVTTQYGVFDQGTLTAGVIATIVNGVSSTYISGDYIYIGDQSSTTVINGKASASEFNAVKATVDNLTGNTIVESYVGASLVTGTTVTANNTFVHDGDTIYKRAMRWTSGGTAIATVHALGDTTSIILNHSHDMTVDSSGNVTVGDAQTTQGTFNIADTAFYKARVASAWNSGGATAKADKQSQYAPYGGSVTINIQYVNNEGTTVNTGRSVTIWNTDCSHTFGEIIISSNGTFYPSTYGYSGFSKVIVSGVRNTEHQYCVDGLTRSGVHSVMYVPDSGGITLSIKVRNISDAQKVWYWRTGSMTPTTMYT